MLNKHELKNIKTKFYVLLKTGGEEFSFSSEEEARKYIEYLSEENKRFAEIYIYCPFCEFRLNESEWDICGDQCCRCP